MTSSRRHNRAPLRRSTAPEKILASGLAAAACVGVVGVIGVRTLNSNEASEEVASSDQATAVAIGSGEATSGAAPAEAVVVSKDGLTREQLDAYAAALAAEKHRLDVYRVELAKAARQLQEATGTSTVGVTAVQAGTPDEAPIEAELSTPVPALPAPAEAAAVQPAAVQPAVTQPAVTQPTAAPATGNSTTKSS